MDESTETIKAVRELLQFTARCYARSLSLDMAIKGIMTLPPDKRQHVTWNDVQNMITAYREHADEISQRRISELEPFLKPGALWHPRVLAYVSEISKPE